MSWLQDYGLVLDVTICLLLVTAIGYAVALNRKLTQLRDAKRDMEKLFAEFADATGEAQGGLQALKEGSGVAAETLAKNVTDACRLADEMAFLVKKGNEIADRLEVAVAAARKAGKTPLGSSAGAPSKPAVAEAPAADPAAGRGGAPSLGPLALDPLQSQDAEEPAPAPLPGSFAKLARRKLSGADSELLRALQAIR